MAHAVEHQARLLGRVRRIGGQVQALERALAGEADCNRILQQLAAIRGAANGLMAEVLEAHLREHVTSEALSARERERELEQVLLILRRYLK